MWLSDVDSSVQPFRLLNLHVPVSGKLLRAFAKLRNVTISFVVVVRMEQVDFHWTDFGEIWYLGVSKIRLENSSFIKIRQE